MKVQIGEPEKVENEDNDLSANKYSADGFESDDNSNNGILSDDFKIEHSEPKEKP